MNMALPNKKMRIAVAMSGGVDSSVAAALVVRAGAEAVGVTLQLYDHGAALRKNGACCAGQDIHDARRVAERLGIAHYVLDYEERFRKAVIEDFAASYARGETPIPCVRCNERVKFSDLLSVAQDLGADALATGHYVRRMNGAQGPELHAAVDESRDQSYFLCRTTREQLSFLRFPLGEIQKSDVRAMAAELGLRVAEKPDSQDICFVPNGDYASVVQRLLPDAAPPGEIIDEAGNVIGTHPGVTHFTVGQRKGLGLSGGGVPLFVLHIDAARARITVGPRESLRVRTIMLREMNWLIPPPEGGLECWAKVRSSRAPIAARVTPVKEGGAQVDIPSGEEATAPGQACALYSGSRVLGGGWIARWNPMQAAA
ncbi:MAG: tRNA 2-thiouridine(34) synthase MnmA [Alphaproteobacteria bacterium]|nr:tRNA 2-thiouridine(34) synthase MnmA [Alphaproteobacteria bacterium]MBV9063743.1 tRNA 2-thiouridine(34) synthase MnmA [Alphaproteobacteria bacterium]